MEDVKRDINIKAKRTRYEQVKQIATAYLQRRNYPISPHEDIPIGQFKMFSHIENETSRPNSILYSCFNNDPVLFEQTFGKFLLWIKDLLKNNKKKHEDLELVIGPLFCHIYLEILRGGHTERASSFLKIHLPSIDRTKCDTFIQELINAFVSDSIDTPILKENFRSTKYSVELSHDSVMALKQYLSDAGHVVLLQVFQSWFFMNEKEEAQDENESMVLVGDPILCNGHIESPKSVNNSNSNLSLQKLLTAIDSVNSEPAPVYSVHLSNVKDRVTCGTLNRQQGFFAYSYNNTVTLRCLQTLQQLENTLTYGEVVLLGHHARVYDIRFFKKRKHLISCSQDKTIRLFDIENYEQKLLYKGHEHPVYCLSTCLNGNFFVSGSYDHTARLWSVTRNDTLRVFVGHTQQVTSIDFHPNCTYLCTGSADRNIRMWSIRDAEPIRLLLGSKGAVYATIFTPEGKHLVSSGEDRRLRVWDLVSAKQLIEFKIGSQPVTKLAVSADEKMLATGSIDGTVKLWNFDVLVKGSDEGSTIDPVCTFSLNHSLHALDYCFGTFGCLTSQCNATVKL
uniref:TFIID subunit TAF5 NTD2 domain-containing protein n=1 Tax=Photinus pyralis TaxID=7054 RepID=A0A1Y1L7B1_PHOPY